MRRLAIAMVVFGTLAAAGCRRCWEPAPYYCQPTPACQPCAPVANPCVQPTTPCVPSATTTYAAPAQTAVPAAGVPARTNLGPR
jgi:hypothetical protein